MLAHVAFFSGFDRLIPATHVGIPVDLFIILSGFMIHRLLERRERYGAYITRRSFRLFPVFFLSFVACLLLGNFLPGWTKESFQRVFYVPDNGSLLPNVVAHLTMLHGAIPDQLLPNSAFSYLPPAWSISLEWQFYLLAPFLFAFVEKPTLPLTLLVAFLFLLRGLASDNPLGARFLPHLSFGPAMAFLPLKLELFFVGAFSSIAWNRLSRPGANLTLEVDWPALMLAPTVYFLTHDIAISLWSGLFLLLVGAHFGPPARLSDGTAVFLRLRPMQWLGRISYSIYIIHWPVLFLTAFLLRRSFPGLASVPAAVALAGVGSAAILVLAAILHRWVEKPCMTYGRDLAKRGTPKVAASAAESTLPPG